MHMEQPASRQSAPASLKIAVQTLGLRLLLNLLRAGHDHHANLRAHLPAFQIPAAARKSEMREFVQLPMNTTLTGWPSSDLPEGRSM